LFLFWIKRKNEQLPVLKNKKFGTKNQVQNVKGGGGGMDYQVPVGGEDEKVEEVVGLAHLLRDLGDHLPARPQQAPATKIVDDRQKHIVSKCYVFLDFVCIDKYSVEFA
jgi:hypothetical protein